MLVRARSGFCLRAVCLLSARKFVTSYLTGLSLTMINEIKPVRLLAYVQKKKHGNYTGRRGCFITDRVCYLAFREKT